MEPKFNPQEDHGSVLTAPKTPVAPFAPEPKEKGPSRFSLKQKLIAGFAGASLVTGAAIMAINSQGEKEEPAMPVTPGTSEPIVNEPAPVETTEPAPSLEYDPYGEPVPETLVQYEAMTLEQFEAAPKEEQALYASWLLRDLDSFVKLWQNQKMGPNDSIYAEASLDNSAQEIINNSQWIIRAGTSLHTADAQKIFAFIIEDKSTSVNYAQLMGYADVPDRKPRAMAEGNSFETPTATSQAVIESTAAGAPYAYITAQYTNGETGWNNNFYHEYQDYEGGSFPVWKISF